MPAGPDSSAPLVCASGIGKRFSGQAKPALANISLTVGPGELCGLAGPDGAGKSTLMRIIAGLIDADCGSVSALGSPATAADWTRIGYMPQALGLRDMLTVAENLSFHARLRSLDAATAASRIGDVLEITGLGMAHDRRASKLSGGMRQKLALACTVLHEPDLLMLDEPTVGLDPISRGEIAALLATFRQRGMGILWSSAYLDEFDDCDAVVLLSEGKTVFSGPPCELTRSMDGRVFYIAVDTTQRRQRLREAVRDDDVQDGMLHGARLRLSFTKSAPQASADEVASRFESKAVPAAPTFEDGFVDRIGGASWASVPLVEAYPDCRVEDPGPAIEARALTKRFGKLTAARDIAFEVARGEVFGLLGPNGAGKSTIFKMLCGLLAPSEGSCRIEGHDIRRSDRRLRQSIGYMAQRFSLYRDLSVRQNLEYFAGSYDIGGRARADAVALAIESFHLGPHVDDDAGVLPPGFRQRLAFACVLLHQPRILFLDEPTSGVDPILRRQFWAHIAALVEKGVTFLITTHSLEDAENCDRIAIVHDSLQIATGTPDAIKQQAGCPEGTMNEAFIRLIAGTARKCEPA